MAETWWSAETGCSAETRWFAETDRDVQLWRRLTAQEPLDVCDSRVADFAVDFGDPHVVRIAPREPEQLVQRLFLAVMLFERLVARHRLPDHRRLIERE